MVAGMPPGAGGIKAETPRMAYYEHVRSSLRDLIDAKLLLDDRMTKLAAETDALEAKYRKETPAGNLVTGFDNYVRNVTTGSTAVGSGPARRKGQVVEIGSFFNRVVSDTTPLANKTNTATVQTTTLTQKKRKSTVMPEPDESDGKPSKRGKVTYDRK